MQSHRYFSRVLLAILIVVAITACAKVTSYNANPISNNVHPQIFVGQGLSDPFGMQTKLTSLLLRNGYSVVGSPVKSRDGAIYILNFSYMGYRDAFGLGLVLTSFTAKLYDHNTGKVCATFEVNREAREDFTLDLFIKQFSATVPK